LLEPKNYDADDALFSNINEQVVGKGRVLGGFGDCEELAKFRSDLIDEVTEFGFLYQVTKPRQLKNKKGLNREKFFEGVGSVLTRAQLSSILQIEQQYKKSFQKSGYIVDAMNVKPLGLLAQDDAGLYTGFLVNAVLNSERRFIVGVSGLTIINGQIIALNYYRPFRSENDLGYSVSRVKNSLKHIDEINNYSFFKDKVWSYFEFVNWWSMLEKGLIGAFIGLLIMLFKTLYQMITRVE